MTLVLPFLIIFFTGCNRIDSIQYEPPLKSDQWCIQQPCIEFGNIILSQPTSSFLVFFLSIQTIFAGCKFLSNKQSQNSRKYWGYSLFLSGLGAISAGISYQIFGYELKCSGKEFCNWTNWFEIYYNLLTVSSVGTLLVAVGYSTLDIKWIKIIKFIASTKVLIYFILCLIGAFLPNRFLISYEFLVFFSTPIYGILSMINFYQFLLYKKQIYKHYSILWLFLFFILGLYFYYLNLGITQRLWENKIWFSANDILHLLMILWILYIQLLLNKHIIDKK